MVIIQSSEKWEGQNFPMFDGHFHQQSTGGKATNSQQ